MFRSAVLHADETPVAMLKPGNQTTHRALVDVNYPDRRVEVIGVSNCGATNAPQRSVQPEAICID